jgi:nitrite reductase/ring-hydroxylating ferredoxin subunit
VSDTLGNNEEFTAQDRLSVSRRWFLLKIGVAFNGLIGLDLVTSVLRYLFSPLKRDAAYQSWVPIGSVESFPVGETTLAIYKNPFNRPWDGETDGVACYVRRTRPQEFQVFAVNCAHLGCPVRWFPQSQLFMCPCHGGAYYADGARASGPPERGLFTYELKIVDGELHINAGQMPTLSNSAELHHIANAKGDSPCAG